MARGRVIQVPIRLRRKNQLTMPKVIAETMGARQGDRFVLAVDEDNPEKVRLRRLRRSYAGVAAGVYGTLEEAAEYVRGERESWGE